MTMLWSDAQIEQIKTMAESRMSASQIAVEIGNVSRNAIVGVGHRNAIKFYGGSGGQNHRAKTKPRIKLPTIEAPPEPRRAGMVTLMELGPTDCHWPIGDPRDPSFRYCGQRIHFRLYCVEHCRLAYETPEQRRANASQPTR